MTGAPSPELLRAHSDAVRGALEEHDGREVRHTGDGIMASFPSAVSAVQAALTIQSNLAGAEVRVRVGLNAGEPIAEDDDLFGTAVQLAARITDRAEPGQVLVSASSQTSARARDSSSRRSATPRSRGSMSRWRCIRCARGRSRQAGTKGPSVNSRAHL